MSGIYPNPLNPLSKVYLEQIATNEGYDKPDEKLKTDRNMFNIPKDEQKAAKERLLAKTKAKRAAAMEALDPVNPVALEKKYKNRKDQDLDNDGDTDSSDKYLHKRRKAIKKAMAVREDKIEEEMRDKQGNDKFDRYKRMVRHKQDKYGPSTLKQRLTHGGVDHNIDNEKKAKAKMNEGIRDVDPEKGTAERKARLEKKRGMKMDDHPQYKKMAEASDPRDEESMKVFQKLQKNVDQKKKKKMKESFSNWRNDLNEVMSDVEDEKEVKEKKIKNKITINPKLGEAVENLGGELLEVQDLGEKINLKKDDMGDVIKDFYKSDAPQFKGRSKEKRREMAIAAKLTAERGGRKIDEKKGCAHTHKGEECPVHGVKECPDNLDERTRYAKETGKDFTTGKPSEKGGTRTGTSTFDKVSREMRKTGGVMSARGKGIQPQGKKKVPGKKGYQGVTPVDRIRNRLAQKRAEKPNPYKARAGESD